MSELMKKPKKNRLEKLLEAEDPVFDNDYFTKQLWPPMKKSDKAREVLSSTKSNPSLYAIACIGLEDIDTAKRLAKQEDETFNENTHYEEFSSLVLPRLLLQINRGVEKDAKRLYNHVIRRIGFENGILRDTSTTKKCVLYDSSLLIMSMLLMADDPSAAADYMNKVENHFEHFRDTALRVEGQGNVSAFPSSNALYAVCNHLAGKFDVADAISKDLHDVMAVGNQTETPNDGAALAILYMVQEYGRKWVN